MSRYRKEVFAIFKQLHRTRLRLYDGDEPNLAKARAKINEEFNIRKHLQTDEEIKEAITNAQAVELYFRTSVIRAEKTERGTYRLKITEDTRMFDNIPFKKDAQVIDIPRRSSEQCCKKVPEKT